MTARERREIERMHILVDGARLAAGRSLLAFMQFCWMSPDRFVVGRHTRAICNRLTRAVEEWREGKSTFLIVKVPFRHGKSEICSIFLPAYFLGRNADRQPSVILTGYGGDLVAGFSKKCRKLIKGDAYGTVFPGIDVEKDTDAKWAVAGSVGEVNCAGLGGAITGKGGNLIVVDDYCKSRAEARSKAARDKVWDAFRNDIFTRQNAPASIVLVVATPWHTDDLIGRIEAEEARNPAFPKFEELAFPARVPGEYEYLCPELKTPEWYDIQRAVLGKQASALLDCRPVVEGGNRFDPDKVKLHHDLEGWPRVREFRGWDLASSSKERDKDDPDWTWGVRAGVTRSVVGEGRDRATVFDLWIREMVCCREEAPARNARIRRTAIADGAGVTQCVEAFAAYKDAYAELKEALKGVAIVRASRMPGDKSAKAAPLEPVFDAERVHVYVPGCAAALDRWREDFSAFPDGAHDDAVDATAIAFHEAAGGSASGFIL